MRETMLHFEKALSADERRRLCNRLRDEGLTCEADHRSVKPHLLFVGYDESCTAPHDLVRIAAASGVEAQVVDL